METASATARAALAASSSSSFSSSCSISRVTRSLQMFDLVVAGEQPFVLRQKLAMLLDEQSGDRISIKRAQIRQRWGRTHDCE
jgi:hypothetical protein